MFADWVTPTFGSWLVSSPMLLNATSAAWTVAAGASHAIGAVAWPLKVSWNVPPVTLRNVTSCLALWVPSPACVWRMSMCATTSVGLNGASVIAFRLRSAESPPEPPAQKVSS